MAKSKPGRVVMLMQRRVNNGLGIMMLVTIMAVTPLVPAAVSATPPQWVWNEKGEVHDATGQFRRLTAEEACALYGLCSRMLVMASAASAGPTGSGEGGPDGGGCR